MGEKPIRVLIVDDSAFMRLQLRSLIKGDERFVVVGEASDGEEALKLVEALQPDVMVLDLQLPKKDGLEVLAHVMQNNPLPVLIVSMLAKENAEITLKALKLGAVDFITKPSPNQAHVLKEEFPKKLYFVSKANLKRLQFFSRKIFLPYSFVFREKFSKIIVVGASIGGPQTLHYLLSQLPADFPAPLLVVQHMPKVYVGKFVQSLSQHCCIRVKEGEAGEKIFPGTVYVAPGGCHLLVDRFGKLQLSDGEPVNSVKPSLDVTLISSAVAFGEKVVAVILTGMGKDGTEGAKEVKKRGGIVVAESQESCVVYGMSKSVIEAGFCDYPLPLEKIPNCLMKVANVR
jgi:two-component system chemotaxis response regulator CheB